MRPVRAPPAPRTGRARSAPPPAWSNPSLVGGTALSLPAPTDSVQPVRLGDRPGVPGSCGSVTGSGRAADLRRLPVGAGGRPVTGRRATGRLWTGDRWTTDG